MRAPLLALLAVTAAGGAAGAWTVALGAGAAAVLVAGLSVPARPAARAAFVALVLGAALKEARRPEVASLVLAQGLLPRLRLVLLLCCACYAWPPFIASEHRLSSNCAAADVRI